MTQQDSHNVKV